VKEAKMRRIRGGQGICKKEFKGRQGIGKKEGRAQRGKFK
jgi:hypothetical protein